MNDRRHPRKHAPRAPSEAPSRPRSQKPRPTGQRRDKRDTYPLHVRCQPGWKRARPNRAFPRLLPCSPVGTHQNPASGRNTVPCSGSAADSAAENNENPVSGASFLPPRCCGTRRTPPSVQISKLRHNHWVSLTEFQIKNLFHLLP